MLFRSFRYVFPKNYNKEHIANDIKSSFSKDRINLLFFGNVNESKGIDILLNAFNIYDELLGETNTQSAQKLWFMSQCNIKARQVAIYINNNSVKIEPGAMSYFQGNLEMVSGVTVTNMLGRAISGMLTGEKMAMPEYRGSGILVLEPSFTSRASSCPPGEICPI